VSRLDTLIEVVADRFGWNRGGGWAFTGAGPANLRNAVVTSDCNSDATRDDRMEEIVVEIRSV